MTAAKLLTPLEAAAGPGSARDFYAAYPLREWALVKKIRQMTAENVSGELCSLRFTWQRPRQQADDEKTFLYQTLPWLVDAAWVLADAPLATLRMERVAGENNLFGLAMFANGVTAEIEANECLPNSMPASYFIKANFKHGHLTNQPMVGHFNEEGSILADDSRLQRWVVENAAWDGCTDEIELCRRSLAHAIGQGTYPAGPLNSKEILKAVRGGLS